MNQLLVFIYNLQQVMKDTEVFRNIRLARVGTSSFQLPFFLACLDQSTCVFEFAPPLLPIKEGLSKKPVGL